MTIKELKLKEPLKKSLTGFVEGLKKIYAGELIFVALYGSAASGEFSDRFSDINLLVVLQDTSLKSLKKVTGLLSQRKFRSIQPLFLTERYINKSLDVFPIEFMDIKENYVVLSGKDIFKDTDIDLKNLRFQCEQELKVKLINIKHQFLNISRDDKAGLDYLLFRSFTSVLHLLRNVLRLKGRPAPYPKEDVIDEFGTSFQIDTATFKKILTFKNNPKKASLGETLVLLDHFVNELEKITEIVDEL